MNTVNIEDAQIGYKNFRGEVSDYNDKGDRNFVVFLTKDQADYFSGLGFNVKTPESDDPDNPRDPYLQVSCSFKAFPPKVVLIAGSKKSLLSEEELEVLDYSNIIHADLVINPYHWEVAKRSGIKAYVKALYVEIEVDDFADKYGI